MEKDEEIIAIPVLYLSAIPVCKLGGILGFLKESAGMSEKR